MLTFKIVFFKKKIYFLYYFSIKIKNILLICDCDCEALDYFGALAI